MFIDIVYKIILLITCKGYFHFLILDSKKNEYLKFVKILYWFSKVCKIINILIFV